MGAVKLWSLSLTERQSRTSFDCFDQAAPISARPTKTQWLATSSVGDRPLMDAVLFLRYGLFLLDWCAGSLVQDLLGQPRLLPRMLFGRGPTASLWLIWPEDGFASIA